MGNDEAMAQGLFNAWAISADKIIPNETIRHKVCMGIPRSLAEGVAFSQKILKGRDELLF